MEDVSGSHVLQGDVLDICSEIEDDYFDAIFTDPPYGLNFMGRKWDHGVPSAEVWKEIMRTVKPGGHIMAFGGTRTYHRLAVNIEDAGWEIRDCFMWLYGTGFPKSHNISKALDKKAGAEREVVGKKRTRDLSRKGGEIKGDMLVGKSEGSTTIDITAPATQATKRFEGYGTALTPAYEPIVLAMKPRGKSFADCALEHGVAGLNIDGGRIEYDGEENPTIARRKAGYKENTEKAAVSEQKGRMKDRSDPEERAKIKTGDKLGRFPANLILDEAAGDRLDDQAGDEKSRFFYTAKASKAEREAGLESDGGRANTHPTVKPLDLCRYFSTLLLPPEREDNRKIMIPFAGSGSEMIGARAAGWEFVAGIEKEEEYCEIAEKRLEYWENEEIE